MQLNSAHRKRGSEIKPVTAVEKAQILQIRREFANRKKKFLHSEEGVNEALKEVRKLFEKLKRFV